MTRSIADLKAATMRSKSASQRSMMSMDIALRHEGRPGAALQPPQVRAAARAHGLWPPVRSSVHPPAPASAPATSRALRMRSVDIVVTQYVCISGETYNYSNCTFSAMVTPHSLNVVLLLWSTTPPKES